MFEQSAATLLASGVEENKEALAADAGYFREDPAIKDIEKKGAVLRVCTQKRPSLGKA